MDGDRSVNHPAPEQIKEMVDQASTQWVDQYNQHLLLTVQAVHRLHHAFDSKFTR